MITHSSIRSISMKYMILLSSMDPDPHRSVALCLGGLLQLCRSLWPTWICWKATWKSTRYGPKRARNGSEAVNWGWWNMSCFGGYHPETEVFRGWELLILYQKPWWLMTIKGLHYSICWRNVDMGKNGDVKSRSHMPRLSKLSTPSPKQGLCHFPCVCFIMVSFFSFNRSKSRTVRTCVHSQGSCS